MNDKYDHMNEVATPEVFFRWLMNFATDAQRMRCVKYLFDGAEDFDTEDRILTLSLEFYDELYEMLEDEGVIDNSEPYDPHWLRIPMGI